MNSLKMKFLIRVFMCILLIASSMCKAKTRNKNPPIAHVTSAELPIEHRQGALELPDTTNIRGELTEQLEVDLFFSMWFVFLNDDVIISEKEYTILAPLNDSPTTPESFLGDRNYVRYLVLNHMVLGQLLQLNKTEDRFSIEACGGELLVFQRDNDGLTVNGVRIVQEAKVSNGNILILKDYMFVHKDSEHTTSVLPSVESAAITDLVPETMSMTEIAAPTTAKAEQQAPPRVQAVQGGTTMKPLVAGHGASIKDSILEEDKLGFMVRPGSATSRKSLPFYEEIQQVLGILRSGSAQFLHYMQKYDLSSLFQDDETYTVFVPVDEAFTQWYPIDWGFNPFSVDEFTKDIISNHFIRGNVIQADIKDSYTTSTLGGRKLIFHNNGSVLTVNDVDILRDSDTPVAKGNIIFLLDILFVDHQTVLELNKHHKDKETAPLLAFPWYRSQFLSHAFLSLERREKFSFIVDYINRTDLAPYIPGSGYTFFVPVDEAFWELLLQDAPDALILDDEFRKTMLLNHFVKGYLYQKDLQNGLKLQTIGEKTITIFREGDNFRANNANILESNVFVYNLGNMFFIDRVLFTEMGDVIAILNKHPFETAFGGEFFNGNPTEVTSIGTNHTSMYRPPGGADTEEAGNVSETGNAETDSKTEMVEIPNKVALDNEKEITKEGNDLEENESTKDGMNTSGMEITKAEMNGSNNVSTQAENSEITAEFITETDSTVVDTTTPAPTTMYSEASTTRPSVNSESSKATSLTQTTLFPQSSETSTPLFIDDKDLSTEKQY